MPEITAVFIVTCVHSGIIESVRTFHTQNQALQYLQRYLAGYGYTERDVVDKLSLVEWLRLEGAEAIDARITRCSLKNNRCKVVLP